MHELPTGTVTFLFTDVEGSTRLLQERGERYADALAEHRRVLREVFERHGGVEVDAQGDAFFVAFARASDAAAAAEEAQRVLGIPVRMGIHTGEPTLTGEGYVGIDVHRAARICAAGHGGQVILSQHALVDGYTVRDLGLHRLKDLQEPERLYQLGEQEFPPLRSLNATNLPVQPNALVDRERELDELQALVRGGARLLTLTGPGGIGKTRLALQVAAELVDHFGDGVFWVPLAALREPELVLPTIEQTLGAKVPLAEHVDEKRMLLLLDNVEQVLAVAPALSELLERCPNLLLFATSRALLRIAGERDYLLDPLPEADAVGLFRERATDADPLTAVSEICRRLDGLPLAVELAAARTRVLSPDQLLERLDRALPVLTGGRRDAPERQRTLRATIEWSYELLDEQEQRLFRRLAVFSGSFTVEAAEQLCEADLETLESLLDKSLVRRWASSRLGMLETIREFAVEKLDLTDEAAQLRRRHAEFFLEVCRGMRPVLFRLDDAAVAAMQRLSSELDNIRGALDWLIAEDPDRAAQMLVPTMGRFWARSGMVREGRHWADHALERLRPDSPARLPVLELAGRLAAMGGDADRAEALTREAIAIARARREDATAARLLITLGDVALGRGAPRDAKRMYEDALALVEASGDDRAITLAVAGLGQVAEAEGDLDRAAALLDSAVSRSQARNLMNLPPLLGLVGSLALRQGDGARAEGAFRSALELAVERRQVLTAENALAGIAAARALRRDIAGAARACAAVDALCEKPRASEALAEFAGYLGEVGFAPEADRPEMTLEEAVAYALADS